MVGLPEDIVGLEIEVFQRQSDPLLPLVVALDLVAAAVDFPGERFEALVERRW